MGTLAKLIERVLRFGAAVRAWVKRLRQRQPKSSETVAEATGVDLISRLSDELLLEWGTNAEVWSTERRGRVCVLDTDSAFCLARVFSERAMTTSTDHAARVWCLITGRLLCVMPGHTAPIEAFDLSGAFAVTGAADRRIGCWDAETGLCRGLLEGHASPPVKVRVRCWRLPSLEPLFTARVCLLPAYRIVLEHSLLFVQGDELLRVYDVETGQLHESKPLPRLAREMMRVHRDRLLSLTYDEDGELSFHVVHV
ncbi:F-box/WD repeat-containing protein 7-like [Pollicipes pollicipes]|uniref:F-box/WD repeat-containing protein 7-like n=1 Tax=Pollicipes pollicipes TaxID=41117 RepID=UPI0018850F49|nr:F-box/WD repeat-containing protein 7-like [Pollicipes pollicipes]